MAYTSIGLPLCMGVWAHACNSQTGSMAQAAADPLAVESTWMDVLTLASERQNKPQVNTRCQLQTTDVRLFSLKKAYLNLTC